MGCVWLLLLLWGSTCVANFTNFTFGSSLIPRDDGQWYYYGWVPRPDSNGQEPLTLQHAEAALTAYYEAVYLANVAYMALDTEDPIFLRYFEPWDFDFIKGIFGSISGALDDNAAFGSPDIRKFYVCDGSCATDPGICERDDPALVGVVTAVVKWNEFYPNEIIHLPGLPPESATLSLCDNFFTYHLLAERQCSDIYGDNDNVLMTSRGSIMLHELTHWRTLNVKAPDFDFYVQTKKNLNNIIDYFLPKNSPFRGPAHGYGAFNSHQLVGHANGDATINSDNYRWYALSKFWQLRCPEKNNGQGWGTAVDDSRPGPPVAPADQPGRCPDEYDVPFVDAEIPDPESRAEE